MNGTLSFDQAASSIGQYYGQYLRPGEDMHTTYLKMYSAGAQNLYQAYQPVRVKFQALTSWYQQLQTGQRHDVTQYERAWAAFKQQYGGGQ